MDIEKIIKNKVNGIYMKSVAARKGWDKAEAAKHVSDFLFSGTKKSFFVFIENK